MMTSTATVSASVNVSATNAGKKYGFVDLDDLHVRVVQARDNNMDDSDDDDTLAPLKSELCADAWAYGKVLRDAANGRDATVTDEMRAFVKERIVRAFCLIEAHRPVANEACECFLDYLEKAESYNRHVVKTAYRYVNKNVLVPARNKVKKAARMAARQAADAAKPAPQPTPATRPPYVSPLLTVEKVDLSFNIAKGHVNQARTVEAIIKMIRSDERYKAAENIVLRDSLYGRLRALYGSTMPPIASADRLTERLAYIEAWFQKLVPESKPQRKFAARPGQPVYVAPVTSNTHTVSIREGAASEDELMAEPVAATDDLSARLPKEEHDKRIKEQQALRDMNRRVNEEAAKAAEARRAAQDAARRAKPVAAAPKKGKKGGKGKDGQDGQKKGKGR